jgi:hypothetical protein
LSDALARLLIGGLVISAFAIVGGSSNPPDLPVYSVALATLALTNEPLTGKAWDPTWEETVWIS